MADATLTHRIHIPCYLTDRYRRLTPQAFMDLAQEAAGAHAARFGMGFDDLLRDRLAWIISRMHFEFQSLPMWGDDVDLTTWHKGCEDGLFYRREFRMTDAHDGRTLVQGTSGWLLLHMDERRWVRSSPLCNRTETICHDNVLPEPAPRLRVPHGATLERCFEHAVCHSDIDRNFHVNNVKYAVWAMDALPAETVTAKVRSFTINFLHECREGATVTLSRAALGPGAWIVEGRAGSEPVFLAEVVLD